MKRELTKSFPRRLRCIIMELFIRSGFENFQQYSFKKVVKFVKKFSILQSFFYRIWIQPLNTTQHIFSPNGFKNVFDRVRKLQNLSSFFYRILYPVLFSMINATRNHRKNTFNKTSKIFQCLYL